MWDSLQTHTHHTINQIGASYLSTFVIPKQLTPRGRLGGSGGGPMGSSLPRHGARIRTKTQSKKNKNQRQTAS